MVYRRAVLNDSTSVFPLATSTAQPRAFITLCLTFAELPDRLHQALSIVSMDPYRGNRASARTSNGVGHGRPAESLNGYEAHLRETVLVYPLPKRYVPRVLLHVHRGRTAVAVLGGRIHGVVATRSEGVVVASGVGVGRSRIESCRHVEIG